MSKSGPIAKSDPRLQGLSDKQAVFVLEYIGDLDATRAAKEAGYKQPQSTGSKLLRNDKVNRAIQEVVGPKLVATELNSENILKQLSNFLFRDIVDFVDKDGFLKCDINAIPEEARQCIDSFETQDEWNEDGNVCGQKVKVKLVSKGPMLELAMKYAKLVGPQTQVNVGVGLDWSQFYGVEKQGDGTDTGRPTIEEG